MKEEEQQQEQEELPEEEDEDVEEEEVADRKRERKSRWYIDALDARAGRAFVSLRPVGLAAARNLDDFHQSFYISPPSFEPEALTGAAIGLSSTRGTFQSGLYDEEGEVPFPSLASVTDFVRRSYISGGGSADPDGDGPPEPPDDGEPDGDDPLRLYKIEADHKDSGVRSETESLVSGLADHFLKRLAQFGNNSGKSNRGEPTKFSFGPVKTGSGGGGGVANISERLVRAISILWLDLLYRAPVETADAEKWRLWSISVSTLCDVFEYLRLREYIIVDREYSWKIIEDAADETNQYLTDVSIKSGVPLKYYWRHRGYWMDLDRGDYLSSQQGALLHWLGPQQNYLFWQYGYSFAHFDNIKEVFSEYIERRYRSHLYFSWSDVIDNSRSVGVSALSDLPLPLCVSHGMNFGSVGRRRANLFNYLSVCCATPAEVFTTRQDSVQQARFDLLLFSVCLTVSEPERAGSGKRVSLPAGVPSVLKNEIAAWHDMLAKKSLNWLPSSLPKYAFERDTEAMIGAARRLALV